MHTSMEYKIHSTILGGEGRGDGSRSSLLCDNDCQGGSKGEDKGTVSHDIKDGQHLVAVERKVMPRKVVDHTSDGGGGDGEIGSQVTGHRDPGCIRNKGRGSDDKRVWKR